MAIKNLPVQLNSAGYIKIGIKGEMITSAKGKEFRPPKKLDHFRITTTERDENGDYLIDTELTQKIIETGNCIVNSAGNLIGIPIRLLYDNTDENFPTQYACYASGKLICSGDGETAKKRIDDFTKNHPCPCSRLSPDYEKNDKCKPTGKLTCIIDEAGLFGQAHTFRTTSMNSVRGILGGIRLLKAATKGRVAGLPLMLTMNAKQTSTPSGVPTTVYIVSICYRGSMSDLRQEVLTMLSQEKQYLIGMNSVEPAAVGIQPDTEEEQEFVEEFFPNAVVVNTEVVDTKTVNTETKIEIEEDAIHVEEPEETKPASLEATQTDNETTGQNETAKNVSSIPESTSKPDLTPGVNSAPNPSSNPFGIILKGRLLKEGGSYAVLYNRMMMKLQEDNQEGAMKLAKRLTVEYLKTWFDRERPTIVLPPKLKKPELLERLQTIFDQDSPVLSIEPPMQIQQPESEDHPFLAELAVMTDQKQVADAMTKFFHPIPINRTLEIPGLIALAKKMIGTEKPAEDPIEQTEQEKDQNQQKPTEQTPDTPTSDQPEPVKFPRDWDDKSGPIQKDQLRTIVQLKNVLVNNNLLNPAKWFDHVAYFLGPDGQSVDTAVKLSRKQGDTFIAMLEKQTEKIEDTIPF